MNIRKFFKEYFGGAPNDETYPQYDDQTLIEFCEKFNEGVTLFV
jgi:hypothetical protein